MLLLCGKLHGSSPSNNFKMKSGEDRAFSDGHSAVTNSAPCEFMSLSLCNKEMFSS